MISPLYSLLDRVAPRGLTVLLPAALLLCAAGPAAASGIDKTFSVRSGGELVVDAEGASISVAGGAKEVRVRIERGNDSRAEIEDDYDVDLQQSGDRVSVVIEKRRGGLLSWGWRHGLSVTVDVPTAFDVSLSTSGGSVEVGDLEGEVTARTSGGSVRVGDVRGPVAVRTSGGSIRVDGAVGDVLASTSGGSIVVGDVDGDVEVKTSGGSIDIERARGQVAARTSGGSIGLRDIAGAVEAHTSGGSVRAYISRQPEGPSSLTTSGGRVEVTLADTVAVDLDAHASGRVRSEVEVASSYRSQRRLSGKINGGGPELYLKSSGGSVVIRGR